MTSALLALVSRDLKLATRIGGGFSLGLVFYLSLIAILPFAVGPDLALLSRIGPAILWIGALLATLIGLDRLFQADEEDGSLDLLRMSGVPLEAIVAAKGLAHWIASGLPLALASPLFGLMLGIEPAGLGYTAAEPRARHDRAHLHGRDRGGAHRDVEARRHAAVDPRRAADGADPDLRRRRRGSEPQRGSGLRHALPRAVRACARRDRRGLGRGGGRAARAAMRGNQPHNAYPALLLARQLVRFL